MTSSVVGTATQVMKGKLTALYLGAEGVGVYNQISLCFTLMLTVCVLGFPNGITRTISVQHDAKNGEELVVQLSSPFFFLGLLSIFVAGIGALFAGQISNFLFVDNGERATLVALVLAGVPLAVAGNIYKALLNGTRSVRTLVRARMSADIASVVVFAGLLIPFGITGAVLGFASLQGIYLVLITYGARGELGNLGVPRFNAFRWDAVKQNFGYGLHGLIVAAAGSLTILILSRWIIDKNGLADSGLFNVAYKVATVYLAGVYAAASGYYYASVVRADTDKDLAKEIDNAIFVYMSLIPPIVVALMAGGEVLLYVLFSKEFIPAAFLLLIFLPADIFRLVAEIIGQALVAKRKLAVSIVLYLSWLGIYTTTAYFLIGDYGITGVALGYLIGQLSICILMLIVGKRVLSFSPNARSWRFIIRGALVAIICAFVTYSIDNPLWKIAAGGALIAVWFGLSALESDFRRQIDKAASAVRELFAAKQ